MDEKAAVLTMEQFEEAEDLAKRHLLQTRLIYSEYYSELTGNKVYFKPENMQATGAYKVRGALYEVAKLTPEQRAVGIVVASTGNFALGVAFAARIFKAKVTVVMPYVTPFTRVNHTRDMGAEVILEGQDYAQAKAYAIQMAEERGMTYVQAFDAPRVAAGHGSIALEIFQELPTVDVMIVPVDGGGITAGVAVLAKMLNPNISVIAAEPAGANFLEESMRAGRPVEIPRVNTIADGAALRAPGKSLFPLIQQYVDKVITVEDEELIVAFLDMLENHKMVVENGGLVAAAALRHLDLEGKKIVAVLGAGNMDMITMASIVQHGLILRDRIFTVSVLLPDKPGELANVAALVAQEQGNVIKLEHNQFVSINRDAAVELRITIEGDGPEHKTQLVRALAEKGYRPKIVPLSGAFL
ncbi:MAG: threonine ammonia-lyase [Lachnospiraceae bacterium]|nr:threonine ammonia-lyase [Lachnospiraceae bacterium]